MHKNKNKSEGYWMLLYGFLIIGSMTKLIYEKGSLDQVNTYMFIALSVAIFMGVFSYITEFRKR